MVLKLVTLIALLLAVPVCAQDSPVSPTPTHVICDSGCGSGGVGASVDISSVAGNIIVGANVPTTVASGSITFTNTSLAVTNVGTFAVQATLAAETTKVIGTVNQGTNPWTVNLITGFALAATQTDGSQKTQITDGTRDGTVKAASTLPALTDTALVTTQRDPLPAGTNVIGQVNQGTSPWVENVTQFGSAALSTGRGASGTGIPRMTASEEDNTVTFTLNSAGQCTAMAASTLLSTAGYYGFSWHAEAGTLAATIVPEASIDAGSTYDGLIESRGGIIRSDALGIVYTNPSGRDSAEGFLGQGTTTVRLRCSAYTSGSAIVRLTLAKLISPLALGGLSSSVPLLAPSVWVSAIGGTDGSITRAVTVLNSAPISSSYGVVTREAQRGQATMANSIPQALASDQLATPGTTAPAQTFPVSGVGPNNVVMPLTVSASGALWVQTGAGLPLAPCNAVRRTNCQPKGW